MTRASRSDTRVNYTAEQGLRNASAKWLLPARDQLQLLLQMLAICWEPVYPLYSTFFCAQKRGLAGICSVLLRTARQLLSHVFTQVVQSPLVPPIKVHQVKRVSDSKKK